MAVRVDDTSENAEDRAAERRRRERLMEEFDEDLKAAIYHSERAGYWRAVEDMERRRGPFGWLRRYRF